MRVTVDIPDREWWFLSEMAEKRGVTVSDLIRFAPSHVQGVTQDDLIFALNEAGLPDADIAARLGVLLRRVAERRRYMGLTANKRPSKWGERKDAA